MRVIANDRLRIEGIAFERKVEHRKPRKARGA
jgi:hypothetical protein